VSVAVAAPSYAASVPPLTLASFSAVQSGTGQSRKMTYSATFSGTVQAGRSYTLRLSVLPGIFNGVPNTLGSHWVLAKHEGDTAYFTYAAPATGVPAARDLGFSGAQLNYGGANNKAQGLVVLS